MDLHGVERLLSALGRSTASLKALYVDCPHNHPSSLWTDPCKHSFFPIGNSDLLLITPILYRSAFIVLLQHPQR